MKTSIARVRPQILDGLFLLQLAAGILLALLFAVAARATTVTTEGDLPAMRKQDAESGTLLFKSSSGADNFAAPILRTEVEIEVSGLVARAKVRQTFRNPCDDWYEGVYVFPLPEHAAVDHLKLRIGDRVVESVVREREQAKRDYERAKASGQRAALLEQERPNIFTSSVANIAPHAEVVVEIEYQESLRYDAGRYSLRFPMVIGPRYIPGTVPIAGTTGTGRSPDTDQVADGSRITPPVLDPTPGPINPVTIHVKLDAGVGIAAVASPNHPIRERRLSDHERVIDLADSAAPADRDFVLEWQPALGLAPEAAWFAEQRGDKTYGLLMVMPPQPAAVTTRMPREVIFIIDTSGSMEGTSIGQAKEALALAIERLPLDDRFNVIEFNSAARKVFDSAREATGENVDAARRWVHALNAQGGTEMASALDLALDGREQSDRIRQIVFLTDGAVGNEEALFKMIRERLGDSRLFTVGIGSAPNGFFMTKAAEVGRGTFTYIGRIEEVREKMAVLFAKLESPVLKGLRVDWPAGASAEAWPRYIPDLYAGEPVVVTAELSSRDNRRLAGSATITGSTGGTPWSRSVVLGKPAGHSGIGALWARNKIESLLDAMRDGAPEDETRTQVIEIALAHHLVTKYTSLVAIDPMPVRPLNTPLKAGTVPTNLPAGWVFEPQWGELPRGATDSRLNLLLGTLLLGAGFMCLRLPRP
ncbi:MAG TPA: marine proteobacterial sortase target protein [Steroidobacteraceae bacterium]|nr:marine proteobacterial sortase target protein [Steroidobacteraceae bacterium]